jgi:hypothetical protein
MGTPRVITLQLDPEEYERLESEAKRLGMHPAALVRMYIRAKVHGGDIQAQRQSQDGLEALDRMEKLTANLPTVDAVQVARESRDELEGRPGV